MSRPLKTRLKDLARGDKAHIRRVFKAKPNHKAVDLIGPGNRWWRIFRDGHVESLR